MHPLVHEGRKGEHCTVLCTVRPPEIRDLGQPGRRGEEARIDERRGQRGLRGRLCQPHSAKGISYCSSAFCCVPILKLSPARHARRDPTLVDFPHPVKPTNHPWKLATRAPHLFSRSSKWA